jgi:hypothetical protein
MEEDERRVMERRRENDRNMIKINAFYEPSSLLYSPSPSFHLRPKLILIFSQS